MIQNKSTIKAAIVSAIAIIIAYIVKRITYSANQTLLISLAMMIRYVIHVSLLVIWCNSIKNRLLNVQVRRLLVGVGVLLAFWLSVRTAKYEFIADSTDVILRYLWYSYYIPMIFVPLLGVYLVYFMGEPEVERIPKRMYYLVIPAVCMILCVFTNDLHQTVFRFTHGIELFDSKYTYGFMYYVIMAWFVVLGFYFVISLLIKSKVPGSKKMQKLPIIIMICATLFWISYMIFPLKVDLTAVDCIIIVCLLESAIQSGMIPSNTHYRELFELTTFPVLISDEDGTVRCKSGGAFDVTSENLKACENTSVNMGDYILESASIGKDRVYWLSDVTRLNALKIHLDSVCEQLSEENILLQAEMELKVKKAKTDEKSRLYDRIAAEVSSKLEKITFLINEGKKNDAEAKLYMAKVGVIGAYIKRRGNLLLQSESNGCLPSAELEYSIRESLENLELCNVCSSLNVKQSGDVAVETAIAAYDFFEAVVELSLECTSALMVHLSCDGGNAKMLFQIGLSENAEENHKKLFYDLPSKDCKYSVTVTDEDVVVDFASGTEETENVLLV